MPSHLPRAQPLSPPERETAAHGLCQRCDDVGSASDCGSVRSRGGHSAGSCLRYSSAGVRFRCPYRHRWPLGLVLGHLRPAKAETRCLPTAQKCIRDSLPGSARTVRLPDTVPLQRDTPCRLVSRARTRARHLRGRDGRGGGACHCMSLVCPMQYHHLPEQRAGPMRDKHTLDEMSDHRTDTQRQLHRDAGLRGD
jgi:hypothetical protein